MKEKKHKILLIDDDSQFQKFLAELLELHGFEVIKADDGEKGLISYDQDQPKLIITDLVMPLIDGIEVILKIRNRDKDIPIIALSGGNRGFGCDYLNAAKKLGATTTFEKPIDSNKLLEAINEYII